MANSRITSDDLAKVARHRRPKYNNRRTKAKDGTTKHSASEARWWDVLKLRERAREISELVAQARVTLPGKIVMIVDARYVEDGRTIWHEYKGFATEEWKVKLKAWTVLGPGEYRVTYKNGRTDVYRPGMSDEALITALGQLNLRFPPFALPIGQMIDNLKATL